jgi:transposase-like protein
LLIDATYFKVRDGLHYENKAFFVVAGIRKNSYCEILGVRLAESNESLFWADLFDDMKERGLKRYLVNRF